MKNIEITISGAELDFARARTVAETVCQSAREEAFLVAWNDRLRGLHSPSCLQCEIKGTPAWETYGTIHGGRIRVSINHDEYVFIFG